MKKAVILFILVLSLTSCSTTLYYWGGSSYTTTRYEELTYQHYDKQTPESLCRLVCLYEDLVTHPGGNQQKVPPGICAEYGYLLLQPQTATVFMETATSGQKSVFRDRNYGTYFKEYGLALMAKEVELYPESAYFIKPLLERFSK